MKIRWVGRIGESLRPRRGRIVPVHASRRSSRTRPPATLCDPVRGQLPAPQRSHPSPIENRKLQIANSPELPTILLEDGPLLAVNKPAGLLTQGVPGGVPTLEAWVKAYLKEKHSKPGNVYL